VAAMKALTVKQPWAWLIMGGYKDVENRARPTNHRGPLAIHVSKRIAKDAFDLMPVPEIAPWGSALLALSPKLGEFGNVIGTVDLVDCVRDSPSPWALDDHWHWLLAQPRLLTPVPAKGRLGLWEWDESE
jgi:hypothetical protein